MPTPIAVMGAALLADPSGVLMVEAERLMVVADLHLEKGSCLAARGQMLPPYDTPATLARLAKAVARHRPRALLMLGDSFHDPRAGERIMPDALEAIRALGQGRELIWIAGNHDPEPPSQVPGQRLDALRLGPLLFRHEPAQDPEPGEVAGHLHPVARVVGKGGAVRRRCFASDGRRLVMPAFGAYAGGLNLCDPALASLFQGKPPIAYVMGERRVFPIALARLAPDEGALKSPRPTRRRAG